MIRLRTHRSANSAEFQAGAPGDWPREEMKWPDGAKLTVQEIADGFVLVTETEWQSIRSANQVAWDAWEASRKAQATSAAASKGIEIEDVVTALRTARDSSGTLSAAQLSAFARVNAKAMLWLLNNARDLFER